MIEENDGTKKRMNISIVDLTVTKKLKKINQNRKIPVSKDIYK